MNLTSPKQEIVCIKINEKISTPNPSINQVPAVSAVVDRIKETDENAISSTLSDNLVDTNDNSIAECLLFKNNSQHSC